MVSPFRREIAVARPRRPYKGHTDVDVEWHGWRFAGESPTGPRKKVTLPVPIGRYPSDKVLGFFSKEVRKLCQSGPEYALLLPEQLRVIHSERLWVSLGLQIGPGGDLIQLVYAGFSEDTSGLASLKEVVTEAELAERLK